MMKSKFIIGFFLGVGITFLGLYVWLKDIPCVTIKNIDGNSISGNFHKKCLTSFQNDNNEIWLFKKNENGFFCQSQVIVAGNSWNGSITGEREPEKWQIVFVGFKNELHNLLINWRDDALQLDQNQIMTTGGKFVQFIPFRVESSIEKILKSLKPYDAWITLAGFIQTLFFLIIKIRKRQ